MRHAVLIYFFIFVPIKPNHTFNMIRTQRALLTLLITLLLSPHAWGNGASPAAGEPGRAASAPAALPDSRKEAAAFIDELHENLYATNDPDHHIATLDQYRQTARERKDDNLELYILGRMMIAAYNYSAPQFEGLLEERIQLSRRLGRWDNYFSSREIECEHILLQSRFQDALRLANDTYQEAQELDSDLGRAYALFAIGNAHQWHKQYPESIEALLRANEYFRKLGEYDRMMSCYSLLGTIYRMVLEYNHKLLPLAEEASRTVPDNAHNRYSIDLIYCSAYTYLKEFDKAEEYLLKLESSPYAQVAAGPISERRMDYYNALLKTEISPAERDELNGKFLELLDWSIERNKNKAHDFITIGFLENRAEILLKLRRYEESARQYHQYVHILDTVNRNHLGTQIQDLRTRYEVDRHVEARRLSQTRALLFAVAFALALVALAIWIGYSRSLRRKNIRLVAQIQEQDRLRRQLQSCQAATRMEPGSSASLAQGRVAPALPEDDLFHRLEQLIKTDNLYLDPNLSIKTLLPLLGTNERYLRDAVREQTGATFLDYLNDLRLTHSRQLLEDAEKYTIEAIATESGFNSRSTFHRVFRDKYGLAPDEYRRLRR